MGLTPLIRLKIQFVAVNIDSGGPTFERSFLQLVQFSVGGLVGSILRFGDLVRGRLGLARVVRSTAVDSGEGILEIGIVGCWGLNFRVSR